MLFNRQPFKSFTQGGPLWMAAREACDWTATTPAKWVGVHPWCTRQKAYREKLGLEKKREQDNWNLEWGRTMEPILREKVLERYLKGRSFEETGLWVKRYKNRLIGASPDGLIDSDTVLEIKASVPGKEDDKPLVDTVPMHDLPQILMQMEMTGRRNCLYARYNGSSGIAVLLCTHDKALLDDILEKTDRFYEECVQAQVPPKRYVMGGKEWLERQSLELKLMQYNRENVRVLPSIEFSHRQ